MSMDHAVSVIGRELPSRDQKIGRHKRLKLQRDVLANKLQASLAREQTLRKEHNAFLQHQKTLSTEFEHRLFNGLQLVASMLLLQRRTAGSDAAEQLNVAAGRINAFGCVHRRLHLRDRDKVDITQHLQQLCDDLARLLFNEEGGQSIVVQGENCEIPTTLAVPLGLVVNELITNSAKHAKANIVVRFETVPPVSHSITVLDEGPGLPADFDPASGKGLGMQIVLALVNEIGGELRFLAGDNGHGTRVTLTFSCPASRIASIA